MLIRGVKQKICVTSSFHRFDSNCYNNNILINMQFLLLPDLEVVDVFQ